MEIFPYKGLLYVLLLFLTLPKPIFCQSELVWANEADHTRFTFTDAIHHKASLFISRSQMRKVFIQRYSENLEIEASKEIELKPENRSYQFFQFFQFSDDLYWVTAKSPNVNGRNYDIKIHKFDGQNLEIGKVVFNYESAGFDSKVDPIFKVISAKSESGDTLVIAGVEFDEPRQKAFFNFFVFEEGFNLIAEYKTSINTDNNLPLLRKLEIDEKGNIFLASLINNRKKSSIAQLIKINIFDDEQSIYKILLDNERQLKDVSFSIIGDSLYLGGLYSDNSEAPPAVWHQVNGFFGVRLPVNQIVLEGIEYFEIENSIKETFLKANLNKRYYERKKIIEIPDLWLKGVYSIDGKGTLFISEIAFESSMEGYWFATGHKNPSIQTKDVILLFLNKKNELVWMQNIPKNHRDDLSSGGTVYNIPSIDSHFFKINKSSIDFFYNGFEEEINGNGPRRTYSYSTNNPRYLYRSNIDFQMGKRAIYLVADLGKYIPAPRWCFPFDNDRFFIMGTRFETWDKYGILYLNSSND